MPKTKLLLVADTYYPQVDGTLRFMEEFIKRAKNNFDISLLVPSLGEKKGEKVTYLSTFKKIKLSGYPLIKLSFRNLKKIKKAVLENEIIFAQGPGMLSFLSVYYGHKYHKKTIFYVHSLIWEILEPFFPPLLKKIGRFSIKKKTIFFYNRCDKLLVPYQELQEYLHQEHVTTTIIPARLGVDIDNFNPSPNKESSKRKLHLPTDKIIIGYVGRISKEKNTKILLSAFKKIKNKNVFLLMVGDGPETETQEFKAAGNCLVTGFVNNVQDYLQAMDIFVMPSLTETTSLATLEAMATGLPVIATKVGFIKKYITKNYNGLFFPRNSSTLLALKIGELIKDSKLRKKLGGKARQTVAYSFSWERSINRIKKILLE